MPTAISFIPTFAAVTLLLGGFNELGVQLTLIGIFAIILHEAMTPIDPFGSYPNFDNCHPIQPPLRDYVLVFGLASIVLVALYLRIHPLLRSLACATLKVLQVCLRSGGLVARQTRTTVSITFSSLASLCLFAPKLWDTITHYDLFPIPQTSYLCHSPPSPRPSHTFIDQWTAAASTLVMGSPAPITPRATGRQEVTDSSETVALKLRVSQLEAALEELKCRMDALTTGEQGTSTASGITVDAVAKLPHVNTPLPPLGLDTTLPSATQLPSPSPPPIDENSSTLAASKPVDATIHPRENLRSLLGFFMEGTRETDRLISKIRNLIAETDTTNDLTFDDLTFETCQDEGNASPASPTSRSAGSLLAEHLPPLSPADSTSTSISPSPYPSPSPSSRLSQPPRTPFIRRGRDPPPPPSAPSQTSEPPNGSPGIPKLSLALDFLDLSEAPCSTPARLAKEVEQPSVASSSSSSSFLGVLEADFGSQDLFFTPTSKLGEETDTTAHPASRATSRLANTTASGSTPRPGRDILAELRERAGRPPYPSSSRAATESSLGPRDVKGKGKVVRVLLGVPDWIVDRRLRRNASSGFSPSHLGRRG